MFGTTTTRIVFLPRKRLIGQAAMHHWGYCGDIRQLRKSRIARSAAWQEWHLQQLDPGKNHNPIFLRAWKRMGLV